MGFIYKIVNLVNGKFYIGSTIRPKHIRKYEHLCELRKGEHCNEYLQRSFNKYGEKNFKFEIIETLKFPDTYSQLHKVEYLVCRELYLVNLFGAEYNMRKDTTTGKTGYVHTQETRDKISRGNLKRREGKILSDRMLQSIERESRRIDGRLIPKIKPLPYPKVKKEIGWITGSKHTEKTLEKIRERSSQEDNKIRIREIQELGAKSRIGTHQTKNMKIKAALTKYGELPLIGIYNKSGELLQTCNFSSEAALLTGVRRSGIANNLCGLARSAGEYIFKHINN